MATLLCLGYGYSARHFVAAFGQKFETVVGTVRNAARAATLNERGADSAKILPFDGTPPSAQLQQAIAAAEFALISVPPGANGDPVLAALGDALARAPRLRAAVYLSTVGVYGDRAGDWVDEETPAAPDSPRGQARLEAERGWQGLGTRRAIAVAILRLAGIYGPGQNALVQIARGNARRIVKPGQVFNRIHVGDIAQAIDAALVHSAAAIFNVADDEPSAPADPIMFAAQIMGVAPPPEITFAAAAPTMSAMALSFWQDCRRVRNDKLKRELGVKLLYPTYREGLRALFENNY